MARNLDDLKKAAADKLQAKNISAVAPTDAQVLAYNLANDEYEPVDQSGGGGGGGSETIIARKKLAEDKTGFPKATVIFSNIDQTYDRLFLKILGRTDAAVTGDALVINFNGDNSANYMYANNYAANGAPIVGESGVTADPFAGLMAGANSTALSFGKVTVEIDDYNSISPKDWLSTSSNIRNSSDMQLGFQGGQWFSTAPITSIELTPDVGPNFAAGCSIELWGEKEITVGGGGSGVSGKVMTLVDFVDVGVAKTSHVFTGLDGNTDLSYQIKGTVVNALAAPPTVEVRINSDASAIYGDSYLQANGASPIASNTDSQTSIGIGNTRGSGFPQIIQLDILNAVTGKPRMTMQYSGSMDGSNSVSFHRTGTNVWNDDSTNITSLEVFSDTSNGIGVGTRLELWALREIGGGGGGGGGGQSATMPIQTVQTVNTEAGAEVNTSNSNEETSLQGTIALSDGTNPVKVSISAKMSVSGTGVSSTSRFFTYSIWRDSTAGVGNVPNGTVVYGGNMGDILTSASTSTADDRFFKLVDSFIDTTNTGLNPTYTLVTSNATDTQCIYHNAGGTLNDNITLAEYGLFTGGGGGGASAELDIHLTGRPTIASVGGGNVTVSIPNIPADTGSGISYIQDAVNGDTWTVDETDTYTITGHFFITSGSEYVSLARETAVTVTGDLPTEGNLLSMLHGDGGIISSLAWSGKLIAGQVIRLHASAITTFVVTDNRHSLKFTRGGGSGGGGSLDLTQPNQWTGQQNFAEATLVDGANIAWDLDVAQAAEVTLAGNRTLDTPTNMVAGGTYILRVIQDGTGSRTLAYGAAYKWPGGTAPTLTTGSGGAIDLISFTSDGVSMFGQANLDFS